MNSSRSVFFQAEDGILDLVRSRGLGDVYKRQVLKGRHIAANIKLALAVPGSGLVKRQAEAEGLDLSLIHI